MAANFGKGDKNFDQEVILKFLKFLMTLWATDLNERPQDVKRSIEVGCGEHCQDNWVDSYGSYRRYHYISYVR